MTVERFLIIEFDWRYWSFGFYFGTARRSILWGTLCLGPLVLEAGLNREESQWLKVKSGRQIASGAK